MQSRKQRTKFRPLAKFKPPRGTWQTPGKIQVPGKIQGVEVRNEQCKQRLLINADTLFEFDKATLSPKATTTLKSLAPEISKVSQYPTQIEGHTDSIGSAAYNQDLSERRAKTVKDWLVTNKSINASSAIQGFGATKPIAPNKYPNGSDNPSGRQKNRRVEVVVNTCP
ncbi:MAG: OmpA family protein [Pseudanabaena sp. SU_2_4]|nr:OmpA family protein [Pseudanabaena sp. SU_2_4]